MIIRSRTSSREVITTKNNQDSLDSATAPTRIAIHPILSRAAVRELVKLNRCAEVHHRTGVRASHAGRGFS
jgi:hypothetical protein